MKKGKFFVFEGMDGCGKSTQIKRVSERLAARCLPHITTRQPGDGPIGRLARAATQGEFSLENETFALLFAAEHYQHHNDIIAPALANGETVLCDRYYYSNLAYQGKDPATTERIISYIQALRTPPATKPDAVIFLNVPPEECMRRLTANRGKLSIFEKSETLRALQSRYLTAFERLKDTENVIIIEAENLSPEEVTGEILNFFDNFKISVRS